jgi:hypothetical protein
MPWAIAPVLSYERSRGREAYGLENVARVPHRHRRSGLLLRNEYLVTEDPILRHWITGRVRLTDGQRRTLAAIANPLGKRALAVVAIMVKPDTVRAWHRQLDAKKFVGLQKRQSPARPRLLRS